MPAAASPNHNYDCWPFTHSNDNNIWSMLLEKAFAKVHGGYANCNSGFCEEGLNALTGAPCTNYTIEKKHELNLSQLLSLAKDSFHNDNRYFCELKI